MLESAESDWEEDSKGANEMTECAPRGSRPCVTQLFHLVVEYPYMALSDDLMIVPHLWPHREQFQWALFQLTDLCVWQQRVSQHHQPQHCSAPVPVCWNRMRNTTDITTDHQNQHHHGRHRRVCASSLPASPLSRWCDSVDTDDYVRFLKALLCCVAEQPPWPPKEWCAELGPNPLSYLSHQTRSIGVISPAVHRASPTPSSESPSPSF